MFDSRNQGGRGNSHNGSNYAIINGRRVAMDQGIRGGDLAAMATNGDEGRRGVYIRNGRTELIDPGKYYESWEFTDRRGNPVKVSSMPDRTKGADIFSGRRGDYSRIIINEQVIDVARNFARSNIDFDEENADWVIFPRFRLPRIWSVPEAPLMVVFPTDYPNTPPIGFYLPRWLQSPNGHFFDQVYHGAEKAPTLENWNWYCCTVNPGAWRPYPARASGEWKLGDNLWTYITLMNEVLGSPIDSQ